MATELKWYGDDILAEIRKATPEALFEVAEKFIDIAASRAPQGDGDLRKSGYVKSESKSTYVKKRIHNKEVEAVPGAVVAAFAAYYTHMVEFGTKAHRIKPRKSGGRLRLVGGELVRGIVDHPGTRARPFIRPTVDDAQSLLGDMVAAGVKGKVKFKK